MCCMFIVLTFFIVMYGSSSLEAKFAILPKPDKRLDSESEI